MWGIIVLYLQASRMWNAVTRNFSKDTLRLESPLFGGITFLFAACCCCELSALFLSSTATTCCRCLCTNEDMITVTSDQLVYVLSSPEDRFLPNCLSILLLFFGALSRSTFVHSILLLVFFTTTLVTLIQLGLVDINNRSSSTQRTIYDITPPAGLILMHTWFI